MPEGEGYDTGTMAGWLTDQWVNGAPKMTIGGDSELGKMMMAGLSRPGVFEGLANRAFGSMPTVPGAGGMGGMAGGGGMPSGGGGAPGPVVDFPPGPVIPFPPGSGGAAPPASAAPQGQSPMGGFSPALLAAMMQGGGGGQSPQPGTPQPQSPMSGMAGMMGGGNMQALMQALGQRGGSRPSYMLGGGM